MSRTGAIKRSFMDPYLSSRPNKVANNLGKILEIGDDGIGRGGEFGCKLASLIARQRGNSVAAEKGMQGADAFNTAREYIGVGRAACAVHDWGTGQAIWQTQEDEEGNITGWRKVKVDSEGRPRRIDRSDFKANWVNHNGTWYKSSTNEKSSDGKYIDVVGFGSYTYLKHDGFTIAMNVVTIFARALGTTLFFHNVGAANLGKHSKSIGGVVIGLWGIVLSINLGQSIHKLTHETEREEIKKHVGKAILAAFDLLGLLGETLEYSTISTSVAGSNIAVLITFSLINLVAASGTLVTNALEL